MYVVYLYKILQTFFKYYKAKTIENVEDIYSLGTGSDFLHRIHIIYLMEKVKIDKYQH